MGGGQVENQGAYTKNNATCFWAAEEKNKREGKRGGTRRKVYRELVVSVRRGQCSL